MAQPSARPELSNLVLRIISAAVLLPLAVAMAWLGGWVFAAFLTVLAAAMGWELAVMARAAPTQRMVLILAAAAPLVFVFAGLLAAAAAIGAGVVLAALAAALSRKSGAPLLVAAAAYVPGAMVALLWLRQSPEDGIAAVLWVVAIVVATDVGAYFAGRSIGGPKLAPRISPSKTWAGLAGGVVCAALAGGMAAWLTGGAASVWTVAFGGALAVVAQGGDLTESAVKRHFGVKDSGSLIPGHGGVLDRLDGFLTVTPVVALVTWGVSGSPLQW